MRNCRSATNKSAKLLQKAAGIAVIEEANIKQQEGQEDSAACMVEEGCAMDDEKASMKEDELLLVDGSTVSVVMGACDMHPEVPRRHNLPVKEGHLRD